MRKVLFFAGVAMLLTAICCAPHHTDGEHDNYTQYVDPKIGSGGHGHVFVGANVPFGMVQVGPTSIPQEWDWTSGYHDSDSTVIGFSHTHLSGTGIGDLFDITVMPVVGNVRYARGWEEEPASGMWSYADRSREVVRPGYYSVPLTRYGVLAEMTASPRVGMHRYTFPESDSAAIVIDLMNGGCWDRPTETSMEADGTNHIVGWRHSSGWAADQKVYFVAEFSKPFKKFSTAGPDNMFGRVEFDTKPDEQILMKVALSPVSVDGAMANLAAEMPGWDFDEMCRKADDSWNAELGKIKINTDDADARKKFYTAMYHSMAHPSLFSDVNGSDYTIFSLWDTYRTAMPLLSIYQPERYTDMINSMLSIYDGSGQLPVWHLWGNETYCMIGNPGVVAVADAIVKNHPGIDREHAYKAVLQSAVDSGRGAGLRVKYGYIPIDLYNEAVANDMEYAVADGAVANAARAMGDTLNQRVFTERSHSYRNYFDKSTGFIRGRDSKGGWRTPFNPYSTSHRLDDYCEGNAWQYTWLVPQDIDGLMECFGSREETVAHLDTLFSVSSDLVGENASPDISGFIGQYAHGNEPGHHTIYLYTMLGEPDKAADKVREVLNTLYTTEPDGLAGNEDAGQMSSWFIMSSLGFYPVEPAGARYWFGSPLFDSAEIKVPGGVFKVTALNNSDTNRYIRSAKLNGKELDRMYITHDEIISGGELVFEMGPALAD